MANDNGNKNGYRLWSKDWQFWLCIFSLLTSGIIAWTNLTNRMNTVEACQAKQQSEVSALSQNVIRICIKLGVDYTIPK